MDQNTYVAFGRYLLSDERKQRFVDNTLPGMPPLEDRLKGVYREDVCNFYDLHPEYQTNQIV